MAKGFLQPPKLLYSNQRVHAAQHSTNKPSRCCAELVLSVLQAMLVELKDFLMTLELHTVEVLEELLSSFDRNYSELAEQVKQSIMQYFTTIRDLEATFNSSLTQLAQKLYDEKYNAEVCILSSCRFPAYVLLLVVALSHSTWKLDRVYAA